MNLWLCFRIVIHVVSLIYIVFVYLCEMFLAFITFFFFLLKKAYTITENSLNICHFYQVDAVPVLVEHIHRTTAKLLLHING
jgi:hypothetical protein